MKLIVCLAVALSLCASLAFCQQPDCASLGVDFTEDPFPGSELAVCTTDALQCCTARFVEAAQERITRRLEQGLREEIAERLEDFDDVLEDILAYFSSTFGEQFEAHISVSQFVDIGSFINDFIDTLERNIIINDGVDDFDVAQLVQNIFARLDQAAGTLLGRGNAQTIQCISGVIQRNTDTAILQQIIEDIRQIRFAVTSVLRMFNYYREFNRTLAGFQLGRQCVRAFVERSLCARCFQDIPPLCSNVCGGIIRGCYSPVYNGLRAQFNIMWTVGREVVSRINDILSTLFTQEGSVINLSAVLVELGDDCGVTLPIGKKRQASNSFVLLDSDILERITAFDGVFDYDDDDDDDGNDDGREGGPRICRIRDNCDPSQDVCVASSNCWDGSMQLQQDAAAFLVNTIRGQSQNPYADFDEEELVAQARALGTPVSDFLSDASFSSVLPEGIEVEEGEPFNGRGSVAVLSMVVCVLTVAAALFFN